MIAPENINHPPMEASIEKLFVRKLLKWNDEKNFRNMPWKGEKDPYKIWLSEVILQQTRVEQGLNYYLKFIKTFPSIHHLAKAPEAKVFKLWEGLGYYSRCKNLIHSAKFISTELNGIFPEQFDAILKLKGVGSYTAAAVASFAFNAPYAVVDGNVFRVLSRIAGNAIPVDTSEGKKAFSEMAQRLLPKNKSAIYNQAIMDFGATVCKPQPVCSVCFFSKNCNAYLKGFQNILPVKEKITKVRKRWLNYFYLQYNDKVAIQQRTERDIWENLYQFFLIETKKSTPQNELLIELESQYGLKEFRISGKLLEIEQKLSHQIICFSFIHLQVKHCPQIDNYKWIPISKLDKYPFPKTLQLYLQRPLKNANNF